MNTHDDPFTANDPALHGMEVQTPVIERFEVGTPTETILSTFLTSADPDGFGPLLATAFGQGNYRQAEEAMSVALSKAEKESDWS